MVQEASSWVMIRQVMCPCEDRPRSSPQWSLCKPVSAYSLGADGDRLGGFAVSDDGTIREDWHGYNGMEDGT